ncbi:hypothetical protein ACS0TY_007256 [Phlomoides rotata]
MATSLEDLLAEEGFKRRKEKIKARTSSASERSSIPLYLQEGKHETKRPERARSHIPRYDSKGDFSTSSSSSFIGRKPRDNLCTLVSEKRNSLNYERRGPQDSWDAKRFSLASHKDLRGSEIVEVGTNRPSNEAYSRNGDEKGERHRNDKNNSFKHSYPHLEHRISSDNRSNTTSKKTNFGESRSMRQDKLEDAFAVPALDEVAVKAVISILSGYAKRFVEDEDLRTSLYHNSFSSLILSGTDEGQNKVIGNLEQAIEIVERAAENHTNLKDLKKASLQLSVITGLNSDDLTSGIPNAKLSACAHLYLSIIYVLQKKDGIAAKHLLQVFCNSPFQARTILLPDLWDHVFLPHLVHLKLWHDKETHSATDSPVLTNSKLLQKVYNESLDSGTYQFAMYYKDWIMDGAEAPSVPLIGFPSLPVQLNRKGRTSSHASPQSMVSKQLYDEVFRHSLKGGTDVVVFEEENLESVAAARSSDSPSPEDKQLISYTRDSVTQSNTINQQSPSETEVEPSPVQEMKEEKAFVCSIPEDFICPLSGLLFKDPVTLETGETFEREAITDWFDKGFITCPMTRKPLQYKAVPPTNLILKRVIDKWKTHHIDRLLAQLSEVGSNEHAQGSHDNMIICVLGQLLPVFSEHERVTHGRRVISSGGLQFLVARFPFASTQEKTFILSLLCSCIEADGGCRNDIATSINSSNLLQLLHNQQLKLTTVTVLLLIELICFNRRSRSKCFIESLLDEEIINAMDHLSTYLQTCPLEHTPLVAVLILNLDLLSERHTCSKIYRQGAIDALAVALRGSISDEKVENKCCRALLILGGFFSSSGKLMTEDWILKLAGFLNGPDADADDESNEDISADGTLTMADSVVKEDEEEESAREKWLVRLSASLVEDGNVTFLDGVCECLSLGKSDLVRVCLTTVAWLSFSLASLDDKGFQICALSALVSPLKQRLQFGELVEHKILASLSLYNLSTIPECRRILVMKIGEEVGSCLDKLGMVTWTAKELHNIIISHQNIS